MHLLFSSILLLLVSLSIEGQIEGCGKSAPIKDNFIVDAWHRAKRAIFGGNKVPVGKWPWQVVIIFEDVTDPTSTFKCGGSIIADRWILTAAHCFDGAVPVSIFYGSVRFVYGSEDMLDNTAYPGNWTLHDNYMIYDYERHITSPNDIALIELNQTIPFDHAASKVCLPSIDSTIPQDAQVIATGFGRMNDRANLSLPTSSSSDLLETIFPLIPHDECNKRWNAVIPGDTIDDKQICGGSYGHGTGKGDSGGPVVIYSRSGRWFEIGITSYGLSEIKQDILPGYYTDVQKYCDWIEANTGGDAKCEHAELVEASEAD